MKTITHLLQLACALCLAGGAPQQGLPYPLQVLRLAPGSVFPQVYTQLPVQRVLGAEAEEEQEQETSQFHSQDSSGRSMFGYVLPGQVRIEARKPDGSVRGSYSYLDPTGRTVKVRYWDDGKGFNVAGNNLPIGYNSLPQPVQETPEVQAAREEHMRLYQQTLLRQLEQQQLQAINAEKQESPSKPDPEGVSVDSNVPHAPPVVLDEDGKELTRYPNIPLSPALYDPSHVHDDTREAVIVETPDENIASAKKGDEQRGTYDGEKSIQKFHTDKLHAIKNVQFSQGGNLQPSLYSVMPIEYYFDHTKDIKNMEKLLASGEPEQKSVVPSPGYLGTLFLKQAQPYENSKGIIDNTMRSNIFPHPPLNGYFENSKEAIVLDNFVGRSANSRSLPFLDVPNVSGSKLGEIFPAAEVSRKHVVALKKGVNGEDQGVVVQTPSKTVVALKDGKAETYSAQYDPTGGKSDSADSAPHPEKEGGFVYAFHHPVIPVAVQVSPESKSASEEFRQRPVQPSISQKATLYGAIPVDAVHDAQVHPFQKGSFKDHQTLPIYVE